MSDETAPKITHHRYPKEGEVFESRYTIEKRLGAGGMGVVYVAFDGDLRERVALKLLQPSLLDEQKFFERFRREVSLARSLSHPNIIRTFDLGHTADGMYFMTMEYLPGRSLKEELVERGKPYSAEEAASILISLSDALQYAHEKGVLHRDIKSSNVLVSPKGDIKLLDFGTARFLAADSSLTQTGEILGTPAYMAPELIRGEPLDGRCDLYALGILAHELVSGKLPYGGSASMEVILHHLQDEIDPPSKIGIRVPAWFEEALVKATRNDRSHRFQSVAEFRDCLRMQSLQAPATTVPVHPKRVAGATSLSKIIIALLSIVAIVLSVIVLSQHFRGTRRAKRIREVLRPASQVVVPSLGSTTVQSPQVNPVAPSPTLFLATPLPTTVPVPSVAPLSPVIPTAATAFTNAPAPVLKEVLEGDFAVRVPGRGVVSSVATDELMGARWIAILPETRITDLARLRVKARRTGGSEGDLFLLPRLLQQNPQLRLGGPILKLVRPGEYTLGVYLGEKCLAKTTLTVE